MVEQKDRFGELIGDALRDEAARCHLPSDFTKRLLRGCGGPGVSALSERAKRNLEAEIPGWDFDAVKDAARQKWNDALGVATIEGSDEQKRNWYTSAYHLCIQPFAVFLDDPFDRLRVRAFFKSLDQFVESFDLHHCTSDTTRAIFWNVLRFISALYRLLPMRI